MIISPFNSIFFLHGRKADGIECSYIQTFSCDDCVLLEVIRTTEEESLTAMLINAETGEDVSALTKQTFAIGSSECVDCYYLLNSDEGFYYITIGDSESETFRITNDSQLLEDTILIEYSPAGNKSRRDVVGIAGENRLYFTFRVPGGFKDSGWEFSIDNENFVTELSDIVELYGRESVQQSLTVGRSQGVPIWFGDLLNRLLTCRYVYIDGMRYARYESSVPEKTQTMDGVNSFVFTQKLQRIQYLEPVKEQL